jgi:hypothetical protein
MWTDLSPEARDMYIDIKYTHDFKVRDRTYMTNKKKVRFCIYGCCFVLVVDFVCAGWYRTAFSTSDTTRPDEVAFC